MLDVRCSIALGVLLAASSACVDPSTSEPTDAPVGISPASLRWVLDWEPIASDSEGFEVVSDLGYRVRVEAGWIGSWGATLIECDDDADRRPRAELALASPWLVAEGHSTGADDPSAWVYAGVESVTEQRVVTAEPIELPAARYCQAHYLLAPISDASEGFTEAAAALAERDPNASLLGASVLIIGNWQPPGGGAATPFVLRSEQAYGKILELAASAVEDADDADIDVVIERQLASMFDQVDFATAEPEHAAWQVLGNLAKLAQVEAINP